MSTRTLNPAPSWATVALAQLRMVALLQRRDFLALGVIVTMLLGLSIWGYIQMPDEYSGSRDQVLPLFPPLAIPLALIGAFWPLGVWRKDSPERRGYFWSLPVARGPHTLVRVAIGWVLLMGACLIVMALALGVVSPVAIRFEEVRLDLARWYAPLVTATLAYLLVSVLAVLLDSPVRWLAWTALAVLGIRVVADLGDLPGLEARIDGVLRSLGTALNGPGSSSSWAMDYLIWFVLGAVLLVLVAWRHRDARSV